MSKMVNLVLLVSWCYD
ncbi:hypothetical protein Zm00014a_041799 [Zea mays]|uniref:Uncharacterized protein n=1 Tax=Zea mays TaxID=4577 RepID=A0A317YGW0_MAIZE|nr:hypothetical protein Zm00014a_041799 [Zea mays]